MGIQIANGIDVVAFLKDQHKQVKSLFQRVIGANGKERERAFVDLRRTMAVHETAEEEIVHPVARRTLPNGEQIVAKRLQEENEAKKVLAELESLGVDSPEFNAKLHKLHGAVLAHAESEEKEEFEKLADKLDGTKLESMRKAVEMAEAIAPTRPHAGVESAAVNMLVGPFASMIDRARDAIVGKG